MDHQAVEGGSLLPKARTLASMCALDAETHSSFQESWGPGIHPQSRKQFSQLKRKNLKLLKLKISKISFRLIISGQSLLPYPELPISFVCPCKDTNISRCMRKAPNREDRDPDEQMEKTNFGEAKLIRGKENSKNVTINICRDPREGMPTTGQGLLIRKRSIQRTKTSALKN